MGMNESDRARVRICMYDITVSEPLVGHVCARMVVE